MKYVFFVYEVILLGILLIFIVFYQKKYRYASWMEKPFSEEWHGILINNLKIYRELPDALLKELQVLIKHFIYTKTYVGCNGFIITDKVKVIIAAQACMLVLGRPSTRYSTLKWIYIYPSIFSTTRSHMDEYGIVTEGRRLLLGVSSDKGHIVLAWDSVEHGFTYPGDGHNVVYHEFAHQLDMEDGSFNGAPLLYTRDEYETWSKVFSQEFENLQRDIEFENQTILDSYGATKPAEFFAVATELYFECPYLMKKTLPQLFNVMKNYYRIDITDFVSQSSI